MTHHCQPHRQGQRGSTNLHLRVVWGHPKTDEPEGNRQLLVDVHQGPAMVLWERKVTVRMRTERPQEPRNWGKYRAGGWAAASQKQPLPDFSMMLHLLLPAQTTRCSTEWPQPPSSQFCGAPSPYPALSSFPTLTWWVSSTWGADQRAPSAAPWVLGDLPDISQSPAEIPHALRWPGLSHLRVRALDRCLAARLLLSCILSQPLSEIKQP